MVRNLIEILKFDDFPKGGLKDKNPIENSAFEKSPADSPERPGFHGNGVTGRRTEPGKHAHAFRMTLVGRDKLPQIKSIDFLLNLLIFN